MNNLPQDESYPNTAHAEAARIAFVDFILVSPHTLACIFTFLHFRIIHRSVIVVLRMSISCIVYYLRVLRSHNINIHIQP